MEGADFRSYREDVDVDVLPVCGFVETTAYGSQNSLTTCVMLYTSVASGH